MKTKKGNIEAIGSLKDRELNELKMMLAKFLSMIEKFPDEPESTFAFINFLRLFLRLKPKEVPLPTIEVMSLLKHEKPTVFYKIREKAKYDFTLEFLVNLKMDPNEARIRINLVLETDGLEQLGIR